METDMTTTEYILCAIILSLISGLIGRVIGEYDTVKKPLCDRITKDCQTLLLEKIGNVEEKIDTLTKAVNNKLFGI